MRRTRSSVKRTTSEDVEAPQTQPVKRSKYRIESESDSDEDSNSSAGSNGKVNKYGIVENLNLSEDSDSEDSEKEKISKTRNTTSLASLASECQKKSEIKVELNNSPLAANLSDDSDQDEKPVKSEYFDFTEILQSQKTASESIQDELSSKDVKTEVPVSKKEDETKVSKASSRGKKPRATKSQKLPSPDKSNKSGDSKNSVCSDINALSVAELLLIGENITSDKDVQQLKAEAPEEKKSQDLEITIALPDLQPHSKKKKKDLKEIMRLKLNAKRRETQVLMHKVHILVWIAHGNFLNSVLNSQELLGAALSLIPSPDSYPRKHMDIDYLEKLTKFFKKKITVNPDLAVKGTINDNLLAAFENKEIPDYKYLVLMFICVLRALGLQCRLVLNLVTVPLKPPQEDLLTPEQMSSAAGDGKKSSSGSKSTPKKTKSSESNKRKDSDHKERSNEKPSPSRKSTRTKTSKDREDVGKSSKSHYFSDSPESPSKSSRSKSSSSRSKSSNSKTSPQKEEKKNASSSNRKQTSKEAHQKPVKRASRNKRQVNEASCSKDSDLLVIEEDFTSDDSESDTFATPKKKICRKVLSTDDEEFEVPKKAKYKKPVKKGHDVWAEVFAEAEEKWLSVDVVSTKIHVTQQLYNAATHPVAYVLAWNNDRTIKDVTRRYVINYNSAGKKFRVEPAWMEKTLRPYRGARSARDKEEDEDLDKLMHDQPKPLSIAEYKNHPLYALKRHLLKFEAIYPPDAPPLGFLKGEPIYARECVRELHSRETWLKEAKLVRVNETPYKIVKARPKYDKFTGTVKTDIPLELFGEWQTEDYMPPIAKDGIVPRNAYGNVDLFKPSMLPVGTVYLELPGVYRVARKLNIDCAAAVTGFDFHSGGSHPVIGGYVVCEEFKDVILDAWNEEADNASKKEEEKRLARVYKNWKRLIRGALILNRVKLRYMRNDD
ncbi:unnamed protein product [Bemisia tabaci]|uniref:Uncharacterized protein n=1 Tax=Bemisia tabaci TaxID=7038 RepID=A0A9P0AB10_BEMTA|nr:unnamed protein product [Bemisia tabaci]